MWFKNTRIAELENALKAAEEKLRVHEIADHHQYQQQQVVLRENKRLSDDNKKLKAQMTELIFDNDFLKEQLRETKGKALEKLIKKQAKKNAKTYKKNTHAQEQEA